MPVKFSNTKIDLFNTCGIKYKFRYLDNLKGDYTASPLLFGSAIDNALNYILEGFNDKTWTIERAREIFIDYMNTWDGSNRLDFFKSEVPESLKNDWDATNREHQELVWDNIVKRGLACLDVYVAEILPQFKRVVSVQNKGSLFNEEGDEFVFILDFIVEMQDGRVVLMDNKTSSAQYPKNKVVTSQQLSLYIESHPEVQYAGYCVLIKDPIVQVRKTVTHQILIDQIPDEQRKASFDHLQATAQKIKEGVFEPNPKSCKLYGKPCEYLLYCTYQDPTGLVPAYPGKPTALDKIEETIDG